MDNDTSTRRTENLVIFIAGTIVSAIPAYLLSLKWWESVLGFLIVIFMITCVYYVSLIQQRVSKSAESIDVSLRYIEELDPTSPHYKGIVFRELAKLISQAEKRILLISNPIIEGREDAVRESPFRFHYFKAIENHIKNDKTHDIVYSRIFQIPDEITSKDIFGYLGETTTNHCISLLKLKGKLAGHHARKNINFLRVSPQSVSSFAIVDEKYIVLETDAIIDRKTHYPSGLFFITDREGEVVSSFHDSFEFMKQIAKPMTLEDFGWNSSSIAVSSITARNRPHRMSSQRK